MHSKHKGTMAETKVVADLYSKGFSASIVVDDLMPFDLIAIDGAYNLYKIQVKYCKVTNSGSAKLELRSCMSNKNLSYTKKYTRNEVDIFAMYVPEKDICLYVKSDILDHVKSQFTMRLTDTTKSNQQKGVHYSRDYMDFPSSK